MIRDVQPAAGQPISQRDRAGGLPDGGVAVGDDEDGGRQFPHGAGDTALGGLVEGRGGFVENQDGSVFEEGASDRHPLTFAAGESGTLVSDVLMNAERRAVENGAEGSAPGGVLDLGFGGTRSSKSDVLPEVPENTSGSCGT